MKRFLEGYVQVVDRITEALGRVAMYVAIVLIAVGFGNVVLRYVGRAIGVRLTSNMIIELQWYMYSVIFLLGFAYILKHNINVRVDFWFGRQSQRRKALIDLLGHAIGLVPFAVIGLLVTYNPILTSWGRRPNGTWGPWEVSPDPSGLPRAPIKTMILVAFITLFLQAIAEIIKLLNVYRDRPGPRPSHLEVEEPLRIE
ncbi:MAG: TRAP transporter small permease subunit [Caldilineales bacterium]|nr:TRAP transporter small permease subunit [Caldilineales bacterium]MDW8316225.1 TRAP transporter small permease subunit [Anaerolineae bacterium]